MISEKKIFEILSLFSGGGFLDIGFINNGFQIKEAIEIEPNFINAYNSGLTSYFQFSNNYYIRKNYIKHIKILKPKDASSNNEQKILFNKYCNIDGIIGGPPCQDYSVGGKNAGIEGEKGRLIHSYLEIVKKLKPKFLFFENVEGLYKNKLHRKSFEEFVKNIENSNYQVWYKLINVLEFGFPQDRPRIVLVAFNKLIVEKLKDHGFLIEEKHSNLNTTNSKLVFKWPTPKYKNPKSLNWPKEWIFGKNNKDITDIPIAELCVQTAFSGLNYLTPNQNEYFKPKSKKFTEIKEGDTNRKSFKRLHRFRYSPTVAYGNNEVHLHPTEPRRLSVREALRLQTVPDEYILPKAIPLTHKFKLISNGVPTKMAELIAKEIKTTLINYYSILENNK